MAKMHSHELTVDIKLVKTLLRHQCPRFAHLPLVPVPSSGTDHALFCLGGLFVIRLPRVDWAASSIDKEYEWLPEISPYLNTAIFMPIFKGNPEPIYPWHWLIASWHKGHNPKTEQTNEYAALAYDLADFLNQFHAIPLIEGPPSRRGVPLINLNEETQRAIHQLDDEINVQAVLFTWQQLMATPPWQQESVWVHGDFLPGNILVKKHRLAAVIDFSDLGIGDPACDLVIAWSLLNAKSRNVFRKRLDHIDDHTWMRGKGWALSIALIMLPYYKNSNPVLTRLARRMIAQVLNDEK